MDFSLSALYIVIRNFNIVYLHCIFFSIKSESSEEEYGEESNLSNGSMNVGLKLNLNLTISAKWSLLCDSMEKWQTITDTFSASKSKNEKELHKNLRGLMEKLPEAFEARVISIFCLFLMMITVQINIFRHTQSLHKFLLVI